MSAIPEGWREIPRASPFNTLVGPLYERRAGKNLSLGLHIEEKHTNSRGLCHGGVLATLADLALGYAIQAHTEDAGLSGFVQRVGARLAFANCYLVCGGERIARASAIFARSGKER
jgi:acyl-coenzyme A thioesterase 13